MDIANAASVQGLSCWCARTEQRGKLMCFGIRKFHAKMVADNAKQPYTLSPLVKFELIYRFRIYDNAVTQGVPVTRWLQPFHTRRQVNVNHRGVMDASGKGFGAYNETSDTAFGAVWMPCERSIFQNISTGAWKMYGSEGYTSLVYMYTFGKEVKNELVYIKSDSEVFVNAWNDSNSKNSALLNAIMVLLYECEVIYQCTIVLEFIKGCKNYQADPLSRDRIDEFLRSTPSASMVQVLPSVREEICANLRMYLSVSG
jgi:hypothetical protein